MSGGWIKLYRSIQNCYLWDEKPYDKARAWIDLLLLANHEDRKVNFNGSPILVSRGQHLTSVRKLAERWGWSYDKVLRYLNVLTGEEMIKKDSNKSRTLITIVNYEVYQSDRTPTSDRNERRPNTDK
jgi:DNA replication protein DnaD